MLEKLKRSLDAAPECAIFAPPHQEAYRQICCKVLKVAAIILASENACVERPKGSPSNPLPGAPASGKKWCKQRLYSVMMGALTVA